MTSARRSDEYVVDAPTRAAVDAMPGSLVVEFGTSWCGHCQAARPVVNRAFADFPGVEHLRIEDGKGRPLGRSFAVRLWPTLVFLSDGVEVARVVRPTDVAPVSRALAQLTATDQSDG